MSNNKKITFEKVDPTGVTTEKAEVNLDSYIANRIIVYVDGKAKGQLTITDQGKLKLRDITFI